MTFGDAIAACLQKYATFTGRATRPEYWWFFLFTGLVSIAATIVDAVAGLTWSNGYGPVSALCGLALILPSLAVGARRLHDTGRSGWWQLLGLIPCIGTIILIVMLAQATNRQTNKYDTPAY